MQTQHIHTEIPTEMLAIMLKQYGDEYEKIFEVERVQTPANAGRSLQAHQVLIKVFGSSVNPVDWKLANGLLKITQPISRFPYILGRDAVGVVIAVGNKVKRFKVGDEVFGMNSSNGCWAQFALFNENELAHNLPEISIAQAAGMPLVLETAFQCFKHLGDKLSTETTLLINGASGGVGSWACLLAKQYYGITEVYATCSTNHVKYVKSLGVDRVIDYKTENLEQVVQNAKKSITACIDLVGGSEILDKLARVIDKKGTIVTVGGPEEVTSGLVSAVGYYAKIGLKKVSSLFGKNPNIIPFIVSSNGKQLEELSQWIIVKKLHDKVKIQRIFSLYQVAQAITATKGSHTGKCIISIDDNQIPISTYASGIPNIASTSA